MRAKSFSPHAVAVALRVSPELEYLQVNWAAHLPYALATSLLKDVLPVDHAISKSGLRNRIWAVGQDIDDKAESAILSEQGVSIDQRSTIVSNGAGEFEKAVDGSRRQLTGVLNAFHIAMKFRAIEQSAMKFSDLLARNGRSVQDKNVSAKWLAWHGRGAESIESTLKNSVSEFKRNPAVILGVG